MAFAKLQHICSIKKNVVGFVNLNATVPAAMMLKVASTPENTHTKEIPIFLDDCKVKVREIA